MKLKLTFIALFATVSTFSFAQQTEKAALTNAVPEVAATVSSDSVAHANPTSAAQKTVVKVPQKVSFGLSAGAMVSNYGYGSYISPSMYYRLNNKFSVFSSVTYLNNSFTPMASENRQPMATRHYLVQAGGIYNVTDKLRLSGSVWRDFSDMVGGPTMINGFKMPASYGTEFNASYKFNENFSIHGSIRTVQGSPYSPYFNNYNSYNSNLNPAQPFGF